MHVGLRLRRGGDTGIRQGDGDRPRRLLWCAAVLVAGVALFACYLRLSRTLATNSDGASNALQAWDMLHGNLLLHGWYLSDVSFYTTELPEYMLVEAVRGLGADVVHISAALTYTLLVLLAAVVARGGPAGGSGGSSPRASRAGREGLARAVLAAGIMLAPQLGNGVFALLSSPDHTGTAVPILVLLLVLDQLYDPARPRWYLPVVTMVLLAWMQVGDSLAIYAAALPLAAVFALRAVASAARGRRLADCAYDVTLAASAVLSAGVTRVALAALRAAGGFKLYPVPGPLLARSAAIPHQARVLGDSVLALFGAQFSGQPSAFRTALAVAHLAGVALVAWALLAALRGFFSRLDLVSQFLLVATLVTLAAGLFGTHVTKITDAHEIAVVLPFGAALVGRLLGARLLGGRLAGGRAAATGEGATGEGGTGAAATGAAGRVRVAAVARASAQAVLAVALAGYLAALAYGVSRPEPPGVQPVAAWLAAHGLRSGLGGYWQAQSATLASGGLVTVAPLAAGPPSHGVYPYLWETKQSWYEPAATYANFLVSVPGPGQSQAQGGQLDAVRSFFGRPARTYHFGGYTILVWNRNILTRLAGSRPARVVVFGPRVRHGDLSYHGGAA